MQPETPVDEDRKNTTIKKKKVLFFAFSTHTGFLVVLEVTLPKSRSSPNVLPKVANVNFPYWYIRKLM